MLMDAVRRAEAEARALGVMNPEPPDRRVIPVCARFWALGIETTGSCEGHLWVEDPPGRPRMSDSFFVLAVPKDRRALWRRILTRIFTGQAYLIGYGTSVRIERIGGAKARRGRIESRSSYAYVLSIRYDLRPAIERRAGAPTDPTPSDYAARRAEALRRLARLLDQFGCDQIRHQGSSM